MLLLSILLAVGVVQHAPQSDSLVLVDFTRSPVSQWFVVNDGVMGGMSSGRIRATPSGTGVFEGELSLENNGGFASVRTNLSTFDLSAFEALVLRIRGDGRTYQVRLRTDDRFDGIAYRAAFETEADTWTTVVVPFDVFVPTFRGYTPRDAPPLDRRAVRQLGLLLGDGREGAFRLEIERIVAVGESEPEG